MSRRKVLMRPKRQGKRIAAAASDCDQSQEIASPFFRLVRADDEMETDLSIRPADAFRVLALRRELRIELVWALIQIKAALSRGQWKPHFARTFAQHGLSLRTARRFMNLAATREVPATNVQTVEDAAARKR